MEKIRNQSILSAIIGDIEIIDHELPDEDVEGHLWWGKFKQFIQHFQGRLAQKIIDSRPYPENDPNYIQNLPFEQIKKEGQRYGHQITEWNDVFNFLSVCSKAGLSELETFCVLSNRFHLKYIVENEEANCTCTNALQAENCNKNCGHGREPEFIPYYNNPDNH